MTVLPPHARGMKIGLFGGTFDPPHQAHLSACLLAMKRLDLDAVWWMVTPGNPLKDTRHLAPLEKRLTAVRAMTRHPRIHVTGFEAEIGTRYTYDTIAYVRARCSGVNFVWIMGSDNFLQFHHWKQWPEIAASVPMAVIDRPGTTLKSLHGRAAHRFARQRVPEQRASGLLKRKAPAWVFLHDRRSALSSTLLRSQGL